MARILPARGAHRVRADLRRKAATVDERIAIVSEASRLRTMLELSWDGEWYRRGYYDDGTPLGSMHSDRRCGSIRLRNRGRSFGSRADSFAERAMDAVRTHLLNRGSQTLLLLTPPFDRADEDPGYIKAYPPGHP